MPTSLLITAHVYSQNVAVIETVAYRLFMMIRPLIQVVRIKG